MKEIKNIYIKVAFGDNYEQISGMKMPDPKLGPYKFVDCSFHPGLSEELKRNYKSSKFYDCWGVENSR